MSLGQLESPPIAEVVCGVYFEALEGLDPMAVGVYAETRRDDFPKHSFHPAIVEDPSRLIAELPPVRIWLVSGDDSFVIQIQSDRFYVNWRKTQSAYPRFSDHDGHEGLLSRTLVEFERFCTFCEGRLGTRPRSTRIELAKIDYFALGEHWSDLNDLSRLLPCLRPFEKLLETNLPRLFIKVVGGKEAGDVPPGELTVTIAGATRETDSGKKNGINLETRISSPLGEATLIRDAFISCNTRVNDVFADLVDETERTKKFTKAVVK